MSGRFRTSTLDGSTGRRVTGHTVRAETASGAAEVAIRRRYRLPASARVITGHVREYSTGGLFGVYDVYLPDGHGGHASLPAHTGQFGTVPA